MSRKRGQGVILKSETIDEMKRLLSLGFTQRKVADVLNIARSSIWTYRHRLQATEPDEIEVENKAMPEGPEESRSLSGNQSSLSRAVPDFDKVHLELYSHKGVTLELLWREYRERNESKPTYSYSHFVSLYARWKKETRLVLRQIHKAGEKVFVDYAGVTVPYGKVVGGAMQNAQIFVGVLGMSNCTFVKACGSQKKEDFIRCLREMLDFFKGVPKAIVVDNLKACVTKADRYDPELNPTMELFALHYNTTIWPTAPRSPTHKAKVETGVQIVERFLLARFRHRLFQSLSEIQEEIDRLLPELNQKVMKSCGQSRQDLYKTYELPALGLLPAEGFRYTSVQKKRVGHDYHVEHEKVYYSVPFHLSNQLVSMRLGEKTIEIFHQNQRVAIHARGANPLEPQTDPRHRPANHQWLLPWPKEKLQELAASIGPMALEMTDAILNKEALPELASRKILSRLRMSEEYGKASLEESIAKAKERNPWTIPKVRQLQGWLRLHGHKTRLKARNDVVGENLRGPDYYANYLACVPKGSGTNQESEHAQADLQGGSHV